MLQLQFLSVPRGGGPSLRTVPTHGLVHDVHPHVSSRAVISPPVTGVVCSMQRTLAAAVIKQISVGATKARVQKSIHYTCE